MIMYEHESANLAKLRPFLSECAVLLRKDGKIYEEAKGRPRYIIGEEIGVCSGKESQNGNA